MRSGLCGGASFEAGSVLENTETTRFEKGFRDVSDIPETTLGGADVISHFWRLFASMFTMSLTAPEVRLLKRRWAS